MVFMPAISVHLQPEDIEDEEILPEASVFDTIRFVVKDLEAEGQIKCSCGVGPYNIRYCPEGIEAYCEECGEKYIFTSVSPSAAEEYLSLSSLELK